MSENANEKIFDLIIIGSGPAGLTSAIYASRSRLNTLLFTGIEQGGQLMGTTEVENFPGFPEGIMGPELMDNMLKQAQKFGAEVKYQSVDRVDFSSDVKKIYSGDEEFLTKAVIIATGAKPRRLGIPGEEKFYGAGVSTCATCDGAFYRDKVVAVVGGGDSAMEEADFLTRFAEKVYILHRRDEFRASKIMTERILENPKIEVLWNTEVREVLGGKVVEKLRVFNNMDEEESELKVDGMFLAIGHIPVTRFLGDELELTEDGYIDAKNEVYTSVDGVFVAGDVQDKVYRQAITAAGAGCKAALAAQKWLEGRG